MRSNFILFFLVAVLVIVLATKLNKWLIHSLNPRASGSRLTLYFLLVLLFGLLVTVGFSHLMLSLFFHGK